MAARAGPAYRHCRVTLDDVTITVVNVIECRTPSSTARSSRTRRSSTARSSSTGWSTDLAGGQKVFLISPRRYGKSSLVRQALDGAVAAAARSPSRSRSAATARTWRSSRATPARWRRSDTKWERARDWLDRRHHVHAARAALRAEGHRAWAGSRWRFRWCSTERDVTRLANEVFALPGRLAADAQADRGRRARRVPGDRRRSTAAASSTRCAPRRSSSGRSATCSPARSRA